MAADTYSLEAMVLGTTKLGEADSIVRMLGDTGELVEAVAKGARKPQSASSARLERANRVELLIARGRSLDVIKETRLVESHEILRHDPAHGAAAACVCELASKVAQKGLEMPRFFGLTSAAVAAVAASPTERLCLVAAADLFKASSMTGSRPSFADCVVCGSPVALAGELSCVSLPDGGVVCAGCRRGVQAEEIPTPLVEWANRVLFATFDDLREGAPLAGSPAADARLGEDLLSLAHRWCLSQLGVRLKAARSLVQYCAL